MNTNERNLDTLPAEHKRIELSDSCTQEQEAPETIRHWIARGLQENRKLYYLALAFLAASAIIDILFKLVGASLFPGYRIFSRTIISGLATVSSIVPISVCDIVDISVLVLFFATLIFTLATKRSFWRWLGCILVAGSFVSFAITAYWGMNSYAPALSESLDLQVSEYSEQELYDATIYYLEQAGQIAAEVPRDDDYYLEKQDFQDLANICGSSYQNLAQTYDVFNGCTLPIKPQVIFGELTLYTGSNGIFTSYTGEANVPLNCDVSDIPFSMCHEAAHRMGIISEKEANFSAYLACSTSSDVRLRYAGYYKAWIYCYNALADNYPDQVEAVIDHIANTSRSTTLGLGMRLVLRDAIGASDHYEAYEGVANDAGQAVNDASLKASGQESGIQSYGEVVDYLIAWHQQQD